MPNIILVDECPIMVTKWYVKPTILILQIIVVPYGQRESIGDYQMTFLMPSHHCQSTIGILLWQLYNDNIPGSNGKLSNIWRPLTITRWGENDFSAVPNFSSEDNTGLLSSLCIINLQKTRSTANFTKGKRSQASVPSVLWHHWLDSRVFTVWGV